MEQIPWVGEGLFRQTLLAYTAFIAIAAVAAMLRLTGLGLSIRAVGENRSAALAAGVRANSTQWFAVLTTGAFAGLTRRGPKKQHAEPTRIFCRLIPAHLAFAQYGYHAFSQVDDV